MGTYILRFIKRGNIMNLYDINVKDLEGREISLSEYRGKVLLIVNTATKCGFTPQYDGLEALYEKYRDQGFEILDFPCNQFNEQAPGSSEEIHSFCTARFNIEFPQFEKIDVNGPDESELYTFLKSQKGGLFGSKIKWNFTKFLVDREGNVVERFAPSTKPEDIDEKVKALL